MVCLSLEPQIKCYGALKAEAPISLPCSPASFRPEPWSPKLLWDPEDSTNGYVFSLPSITVAQVSENEKDEFNGVKRSDLCALVGGLRSTLWVSVFRGPLVSSVKKFNILTAETNANR